MCVYGLPGWHQGEGHSEQATKRVFHVKVMQLLQLASLELGFQQCHNLMLLGVKRSIQRGAEPCVQRRDRGAVLTKQFHHHLLRVTTRPQDTRCGGVSGASQTDTYTETHTHTYIAELSGSVKGAATWTCGRCAVIRRRHLRRLPSHVSPVRKVTVHTVDVTGLHRREQALRQHRDGVRLGPQEALPLVLGADPLLDGGLRS